MEWHVGVPTSHLIGQTILHSYALWFFLCRAVLKVFCTIILLLIFMTWIGEFHIPFWWLHKIRLNLHWLSCLWLDIVCAAECAHVYTVNKIVTALRKRVCSLVLALFFARFHIFTAVMLKFRSSGIWQHANYHYCFLNLWHYFLHALYM